MCVRVYVLCVCVWGGLLHCLMTRNESQIHLLGFKARTEKNHRKLESLFSCVREYMGL